MTRWKSHKDRSCFGGKRSLHCPGPEGGFNGAYIITARPSRGAPRQYTTYESWALCGPYINYPRASRIVVVFQLRAAMDFPSPIQVPGDQHNALALIALFFSGFSGELNSAILSTENLIGR